MINWFLSLFRMLTPREMLTADLVMTQREIIEHAKLAEYHAAMLQMLRGRERRVAAALDEHDAPWRASEPNNLGGTDD